MSSKEELERRQKVYNSFNPIYLRYFEKQQEQDNMFDKQIIVIATVLLSFSLAFIGNLVDFQGVILRNVLSAGWILLGITILSSVSGHFLSSNYYEGCCKNVRQNIDRGYEGKVFMPIPKRYNVLSSVLKLLYYVSLICFAGGLSCLMIFTVLNI